MSLYAGLARGQTDNYLCDLRSDTVTKPDAAMRDAMARAAVGDDVYGEDPSVNRLESELAERLGKEAGLLFPTGTQSNLAAVMSHCGRGDEVIVGEHYHIFGDEAAGASVLAGVALYPIEMEPDASLAPEAVLAAIKLDDPHYPRSRLLSLENTVSGQAVALDRMRAGAEAARSAGLAVHLDGARFFNAVTALGCAERDMAEVADSLSLCLSKGLGAPVGSVLLGTRELISRARRHRKLLGGGMRQAGVIAAAGLHALEHNLGALAEDHAKAERFAAALRALESGAVQCGTNMVFFTPAASDHAALQEHMRQAGVLIGGQSPAIRMVLHRDVSEEGLAQAIAAFRAFYGAPPAAVRA